MMETLESTENLHLVRVFPEQVSAFWPKIRETIIESFTAVQGSIEEEEIASIQVEIFQGRVHVVGVVREGDNTELYAIALYIISQEPILKKTSLVIIGIKSFRPIDNEVWMNLSIGMMNLARYEGCNVISAVTRNKRVLELMDEAGYNTDTRFCFLEIGV